MAKKADLLAEAAKLKLEVTEKNTIAEIEAAIAGAAPVEQGNLDGELVAGFARLPGRIAVDVAGFEDVDEPRRARQA